MTFYNTEVIFNRNVVNNKTLIFLTNRRDYPLQSYVFSLIPQVVSQSLPIQYYIVMPSMPKVLAYVTLTPCDILSYSLPGLIYRYG